MSDFKAKMHPILFRLRLCPRPHWGSLQHSPGPQLNFSGLLLRGGRGREGKREGKKGIRKKESGREGKGEGRGKRSPCSDFTI